MASSQDLLKDTVFQLLAHNQSLNKTLSEVSSLRHDCKDEVMFAVLSEFGCLPFLKSHDITDEQVCSTDVCIDRLLSLCTDDNTMSEDIKAELQSLTLMLKQLKQTGKLNTSKFIDNPRIPLNMLWTLHKEGIFSLENYFRLQKGRANAIETFVSKMCKAGEYGQYEIISVSGSGLKPYVDIYTVSVPGLKPYIDIYTVSVPGLKPYIDIYTVSGPGLKPYIDIYTDSNHTLTLVSGPALKPYIDIYTVSGPGFKPYIDIYTVSGPGLKPYIDIYSVWTRFVEEAIQSDRSDRLIISLSSIQLDVDTMRRAYIHVLTVILSHKPVLKVSQAIKEQEKWAYAKISPSVSQLYKQFLLPFDMSEVLTLLRQVLEQQEVNWQLLLSFVSVTMVCLPETAKLFLEFIDSLLQEGLDSCDRETTIMGMLLARQACFQGPHVFLSYSDWFQRTFSDGSRSLASNRKSFTFLMKFLTDLVPYESAQHIKVHILHPPFVPSKCRQLLIDYIVLAKTRLEDLKECVDMPGVEDSSSSANEKGKQVVSEIESAVKLFETTGKVPTSILEASIFRKPYYIGQFLPALLQPRPLPDMPDSKMRLIAALKRADKIPVSMFTAYEKGCKREASQLLEGVFIDSETDDEMDLSPFEQMENTLHQLKNAVKCRGDSSTSKHTMSEIVSLLCGRLENVLSITSQSHQQSPANITIDTEKVIIESLQVKVIDSLLNTVSETLQLCYTQQNPDFTWLSKLMQSLLQYSVVIETLYNRIFILTVKQGIDLENHHIDCIAAILVEIQFLCGQLPCVQLKNRCQGHDGDVDKTFTECILDMLSARTYSLMYLSLRLTTSYIKYMFSIHEDIDEGLVIPVLIKKFIYLSTRQNVQLRNYGNRSNVTGGEDMISAVYVSEHFQQFSSAFPLTVSEWVDYEISVCAEDDSLTDFQRFEYFTWIVYTYFLGKGQEDLYSIASSIVQGILKADIRLTKLNEGCPSCCEVRKTSYSNSRSVLVSLLQELTARFTQHSQEMCDTLPWLPQQLMNLLSATSDEIQQHCLIKQFFRLCLCLPAYLMFSNTPYTVNSQNSLKHLSKFIQEIIVPHMCEGLFLPASISTCLCQGLCQASVVVKSEELLKELCHLCPVFMMSLMVNIHVIEHVLMQTLSEDNPLKLAMNYIRSRESVYINSMDAWQQATVLFSMAIDSTCRNGSTVLKDFIESSANSANQVKVLSCLVQMLFLQLTYIQNFELPQSSCHSDKLESVLTEALNWREGKYLVKMCLSETLEDKTRSCVNERLVKVMNLTMLRYFAAHQGRNGRENVKIDKFLTGILKAYSNVLAMCEEKQSCHLRKADVLKVEGMQVIDQFIITLIETASPVHLRQVDQDLLLGCGPSVADSAIRALST
ncbi:uncharacterized protein LOC123550422 [Mercenaria mercenaria]|uniref:uncharacterized protein LOC123550422 n=1 Tax=Mercenaria mercenaria TaxID=6596 RepID=UPI00234EE499|nr:uncharacterized protein LOC123550422 [Mercenaria mercenaria]